MTQPEPFSWHISECNTPDCWCRIISTDPESDDMDTCIIHSGCLPKQFAGLVASAPELYWVSRWIATRGKDLLEIPEKIREMAAKGVERADQKLEENT